ncbi:MAG: calcium-binding protein, partial [Microcoleaceae cyanobacterium]
MAQIIGLTGNDKIKGTEEDDIIRGRLGDDKIEGKDGNDFLDGGEGDDDIKGDKGDDTVVGGLGEDKIEGKDGNDLLFGGEDDDDIKGGKGDDTVVGGLGEDKVKGDDGNDVIFGGEDDDKLEGKKGDDILVGGPGSDKLRGGSDADIFAYTAIGEGIDEITDFEADEDTFGFLAEVFDPDATGGLNFVTFTDVDSDNVATLVNDPTLLDGVDGLNQNFPAFIFFDENDNGKKGTLAYFQDDVTDIIARVSVKNGELTTDNFQYLVDNINSPEVEDDDTGVIDFATGGIINIDSSILTVLNITQKPELELSIINESTTEVSGNFFVISSELTDITALQQLLVQLNFSSTALVLFNTAENTVLASVDSDTINILAEYEKITNITDFSIENNLNVSTENFSVIQGEQIAISVSILQQLGVTLETLSSVVIESADDVETVEQKLLIFQTEEFETTLEVKQRLDILVGSNPVLALANIEGETVLIFSDGSSEEVSIIQEFDGVVANIESFSSTNFKLFNEVEITAESNTVTATDDSDEFSIISIAEGGVTIEGFDSNAVDAESPDIIKLQSAVFGNLTNESLTKVIVSAFTTTEEIGNANLLAIDLSFSSATEVSTFLTELGVTSSVLLTYTNELGESVFAFSQEGTVQVIA